MNAYERVMKALKGEPVDRPPVLAVLGAYGSNLTGTPMSDLYKNADLYVEAQGTVIDTFGLDIVIPPFDYSIIVEAYGGQPAFFKNQAPNMRRPAVTCIEDALNLPEPDIQKTGRLPLMTEITRQLAERYKKTIPIFAVVPGPVALPVLIMGMEAWLDTVLFNPQAAQQMLHKSGKFWIKWINTLLDAGADGIVATEGMASATISTRALFIEQFLAHIIHCTNQIKGPFIFHHSGGPINHVIDQIELIPNLTAIAISSQDDLSEARNRLKRNVALIGNMDNLSLSKKTAKEAEQAATACLQEGLKNQPFILCNSGADIPIETPPENIHALLNAAKNVSAPEIYWISCGVLKEEILELQHRGSIPGKVVFLDSMLHMNPPKLNETLCNIIEKENRLIILIYGDCCPAMLQIASKPNIVRVNSMNCFQMLLGKVRYRELMKDEAFMLLPEWAVRWKEALNTELGLFGSVAEDFFKDHRKELVYLDTGLTPIPEHELTACSKYIGLPVRTEHVDLNHLEAVLLDAIKQAQEKWDSNQ